MMLEGLVGIEGQQAADGLEGQGVRVSGHCVRNSQKCQPGREEINPNQLPLRIDHRPAGTLDLHFGIHQPRHLRTVGGQIDLQPAFA